MSRSSPLLKVLVVDDHFVVRSGLVASLELEDNIRVVAEAENTESAKAAYRTHHPMVVLMDLRLPGEGCGAATAALREIDPEARILIFSSYARIDEIQAALDSGALGYLQKSASLDQLLAALRAVANGIRHVPADLERELAKFRSGPRITPREREVLGLISSGCANKVIADAIGVSEDTVKKHVSHILQKLEVRDRAQATTEAIRRGIVKMP